MLSNLIAIHPDGTRHLRDTWIDEFQVSKAAIDAAHADSSTDKGGIVAVEFNYMHLFILLDGEGRTYCLRPHPDSDPARPHYVARLSTLGHTCPSQFPPETP